MQVKLISLTTPCIEVDGKKLTPEGLIAYCARVSSPHQENPDYEKLLTYCLRAGHVSVFEMVDMTVEITTSLAIAMQLLRHRSANFQMFSGRYAKMAPTYEPFEARRQDYKNRQNSFDDLDQQTKDWWLEAQETVHYTSSNFYNQALEKDIAKESARSVLPENSTTRLYMKAPVRTWIHYFQVRCDPATQKEHRDIALAIREDIFAKQFPIIYSVLMNEAKLKDAKENLFRVLGLKTVEDIEDYLHQHLMTYQ